MVVRRSPLGYCGVTFAFDEISGTSANGLPATIPRRDITRLAMHAVVSRRRAITQTIGSIALFGVAGAVGLSAIGAMRLPGNELPGGSGTRVAIIIALIGTAARLFSTAWDPRHLLAVTMGSVEVALVMKPAPEPFELIKTLEDVQKRFGYVVELYPEQSANNETVD